MCPHGFAKNIYILYYIIVLSLWLVGKRLLTLQSFYSSKMCCLFNSFLILVNLQFIFPLYHLLIIFRSYFLNNFSSSTCHNNLFIFNLINNNIKYVPIFGKSVHRRRDNFHNFFYRKNKHIGMLLY